MASAIVGTLRVLLEVNASRLESEFGKAKISVGDFDRFTQNAGRNLQRMVENFSGQRIVAEASTMAAALERVGGVSALTDTELKRVAATVNQAADKLRAMGAEVPPSIQKLHAEIQALGVGATQSTGLLGRLSGAASSLGVSLPTLGVGAAAAMITKLGTQALESADRIVALSNKTGLSTERIQQLQFVAGQTSTTVDALAQASFKLGVNVETGTKAAREGIAALGLSFEEVRAMKPEEQFDAVIGALEGVDDVTKRNAIGVQIFGKQFSEVAGAVAEGYTKIKNEADIAGDAQVRALEAAGDAIERLKQKLSTLSLSVFGGFAQVLTGDLADFSKLTDEQIAQFRQLQKVGGDATGFLQRILSQLAADEKKAADATRDATKVQEDYNGRVLEAIEQLTSLDAVTRQRIDSARRLGASQEELTREFGLSEDAVRLYDSVLKEGTKSVEKHAPAVDKAAQAQQRFNQAVADFGRQNLSLHDALSRGIFGPIEREARDTTSIIALYGIEALKAQRATEAWANANSAVLHPAVMQVRADVDGLTEDTNENAAATRTWQQNLSSLAQAFSQMAQVSDGAFGRITGAIGQVITAFDTAVKGAQSLRDGISQIRSGDFLSGILGAASGIAGIVGAVAHLFEGWFGVSQQVKEARQSLADYQRTLREGLSDTQRMEAGTDGWRQDVVRVRDAYLATGRTVDQALAAVQALWDTDNPDRMRAAMDEINRVLEEEKRLADDAAEALREQQEAFDEAKQDAADLVGQIEDLAASADGLPASIRPYIDELLRLGLITDEQAARLRNLRQEGEVDWEAMREAAERYGIDIDSLGPRFQGARINATAQDIINTFGLLRRGGADVGGILFGMREEISALVRDSLKFGTVIPANMRPWIEELARSGNLIDAQGNKIENLDKLHFGDELKDEATIAREGFAGIITKLDELIAKITGPLSEALDKISRDRTIDFDIRINDPRIPRDLLPDVNIPMMAKGGLVTKPTLAIIGESGPEAVIPWPSFNESIQPVPIPDAGSFRPWDTFDRTDDRDGNRDSNPPRLVPMPIPVIVRDTDDFSAVVAAASRHVKETFAESYSLDEHELSTRLTPVMKRRMGVR